MHIVKTAIETTNIDLEHKLEKKSIKDHQVPEFQNQGGTKRLEHSRHNNNSHGD